MEKDEALICFPSIMEKRVENFSFFSQSWVKKSILTGQRELSLEEYLKKKGEPSPKIPLFIVF
jgi:hypothetical protein